jgi:phosphatidate cytidylyltransferase
MLQRRLAFGTLFIVLFVLSLFVFQRELYWFVPLAILLATLVGTDEYYRLCRAKGLKSLNLIGFALAIALLADAYFAALHYTLYIALIALISVFLLQMFFHSFFDALSRTATTLFGSFYVAVPMALALFCLRHYQQGGYLVFFLVALAWTADTGAYAIGSCCGRSRLSARISPNKTIEGAIAGLISTIVVALLLKLIFASHYAIFSFGEIFFLAVVMGILGQLGDLAESSLKRDAGVKDTGDLGTGHGGVLDIIDSLLFCFPTLFLYVEIFRPDLHLPV